MSPLPRIRKAAELDRELEAIDELLSELAEARELLGSGADRIVCGTAALLIHRLYTAIESALERICRTVEGSVPGGADSHVSLLRDATLELPDVRPAILRASLFASLFELLRFRQFVRHAYTVNWDVERLRALADGAITVWPEVRQNLETFRRHLLGPQD